MERKSSTTNTVPFLIKINYMAFENLEYSAQVAWTTYMGGFILSKKKNSKTLKEKL